MILRLCLFLVLALGWAHASEARCFATAAGRSYLAPVTFNCDGPTNGYLLEGFDLAFDYSDHKPHTLVVAHATRGLNGFLARGRIGARRTYPPVSNRIYAGLFDRDGNDAFNVTLAANPIGQRAVRTLEIHEAVRRNCTSWCRIEAPRKWGPDETAILRGFAFLRHEEVDDNIRALSLNLLPTCTDDACNILARFEDNDGAEPFDILVQYSIAPNAMIVAEHRIGAQNQSEADVARSRIRDGLPQSANVAPAITRFRFSYIENDRFLGRLAAIPSRSRDRDIIHGIMRDGKTDATRPRLQYHVFYVGLDRQMLTR